MSLPLPKKRKSFCPEVLAISLQEKSPTVTPTMVWSGEQGKLEWDALLQDQLPADGQGFNPLKCIRKKVIFYNFFESISWTRKLHTCCLAFLNSPAKSDRHHLRFSSHFSSDSQPPWQRSRVFLWPHSIFICGILWMPVQNSNFSCIFYCADRKVWFLSTLMLK